MKKNTKIVFCLILCLTLMTNVALISNGNAGFPGDKPAIIVEPQETLGLSVGSSFTITVRLYNVTAVTVPVGLQGAEARLTWNPTVLEYVSHTNKLGQAGGVLNTPVIIGKDTHGADYVWVAAASTSLTAWYGNGDIVTVTLRVISVGRTLLKLDFTDLVDFDVAPVAHYTADGVFDNRPAISPAYVYVDPARVVDTALTPCTSFNVSIKVQDAEDLALFSFNLGFNSTVLEATYAHWELPPVQPEPAIFNSEGVVNGTGIIDPAFTGTGTVVTITFHVLDIGESDLHLYGLSLWNVWDEEIPLNPPGDGYFNNQLILRLFVEPPVRIDFTLKPGDVTVFDVMIENAIDVKSVEFKLGYNINVIKCIGVIATPPTPETFVEMQLTVNNTIGELWVRLTYAPLLNTLPAKSLLTVHFQIVGYGVSPLDLFDTAIKGADGTPLTHESEDGLLITVIRDVAIVDIQPTPQKVYPGRMVTVYVVAVNKGNLSETFDVSLYVDVDTLLGIQTVVDLMPGANTTLTFYWDTTGQEPCHWHTLWATASTVPYEYDVTNNLYVGPVQVKIKIPGDINGDGTVNLADLVLMAQAYGSVPGAPNWNPDADLTNDNKVSLADLVTCARYYGQSC